ncbi:seven-hairpin glycosidase, partial [Jaminaea rosea]
MPPPPPPPSPHHGPPGPPGPPSPGHRPSKVTPPEVPDPYDAPWSPSRDRVRVPASAFPPPYSDLFHYEPSTKYANGNPHSGVIPPLQLHLLNNVGLSQRPVRPPAAPLVNSTVWDKPRWSKADNGSRTSFADSFRAHLQQDEVDTRLPPFNSWIAPKEQLDPSLPPTEPLSRVQFAFEDPKRRSGKAGDHAREATLIERQRLVKNAFLHSWEGYKRIAWGHDELRPVSEEAQDPFNGWGATIVDALDTLLVMDLPKEYNYAREHVRDIDFWYLGGERSAYGRNDGRVPVFETAIRYLGGFLSAYDLSGDELMKDRAEELAQLILPAFFTRTGVPLGRVRFGATPYPGAGGGVVLAEAGSMLLEFTRLWQVTGNRTYFDRVQRATDWLDRNMTKEARLGSLLPTSIFPETGAGYGWYSFGGMADSFYEYLAKEHQLLGGKMGQYARMYSDAIDSARRYLIKEIRSVPGTDLVTFGMSNSRFWEAKQEHLACFTGGMLGLGAKLMPSRRGHDVDLAQRVTETCWWSYNSSATGLGPEDTVFYRSDDSLRFEQLTDPDGTKRRGKARGWPIVGVARQTSDYRGRPETIESVLYMWRITGDPVWQDRGWQMFASWVTHAMTKVGFANIQDVQALPAILNDNMESFVFAETFKYYYLLFSPPDLISLDDYVFTTEAHPLLVPKDGRWTEAGKGPRSFWSGPSPSQASSDVYSGGESGSYGGMTNVQKHSVFKAWEAQEEQKRVQ